MSKTAVHVLIPHTCEVACGNKGFYRNSATREQVTCKLCKKTEHFKNLPNSKKARK